MLPGPLPYTRHSFTHNYIDSCLMYPCLYGRANEETTVKLNDISNGRVPIPFGSGMGLSSMWFNSFSCYFITVLLDLLFLIVPVFPESLLLYSHLHITIIVWVTIICHDRTLQFLITCISESLLHEKTSLDINVLWHQL